MRHTYTACTHSDRVAVQQKIAEELAEDFENLSKDFYGRFAVRNCRVEAFRRGKEGWQATESQADKKRKAFMEIFDKDQAVPSAPLPKREAKGKERTKSKQPEAEVCYTLMAPLSSSLTVMQDAKMSEKTKEIYDALLPAAAVEDEGETVKRAAPAAAGEVVRSPSPFLSDVSPVQDDTFMSTIRAALRGQEVEGKTKKSKKERRKNKKAEDGGDA